MSGVKGADTTLVESLRDEVAARYPDDVAGWGECAHVINVTHDLLNRCSDCGKDEVLRATVCSSCGYLMAAERLEATP